MIRSWSVTTPRGRPHTVVMVDEEGRARMYRVQRDPEITRRVEVQYRWRDRWVRRRLDSRYETAAEVLAIVQRARGM